MLVRGQGGRASHGAAPVRVAARVGRGGRRGERIRADLQRCQCIGCFRRWRSAPFVTSSLVWPACMRWGVARTGLCIANMLAGQGGGHRRLRREGAGNALDVALPPGGVVTTLYARAPEALSGTRKPTVAVVLWAVGVVATAPLAGRLICRRPEGLWPRVLGLVGAVSPLPAAGAEDGRAGMPAAAVLVGRRQLGWVGLSFCA